MFAGAVSGETVTAIVTDHATAVWVAHVQALDPHGAPHAKLRTQIAKLVPLVAYTAFNLWVVAQPITEPPAS